MNGGERPHAAVAGARDRAGTFREGSFHRGRPVLYQFTCQRRL